MQWFFLSRCVAKTRKSVDFSDTSKILGRPCKMHDKLTRQAYFDLLVKTSAEGGFPSWGLVDPDCGDGCLYRGPDGRQCAVGLLVPDELYADYMEDVRADQLFEENPALRQVIPEGLTAGDLSGIQNVHDALAGRVSHYGGIWPHEEFVAKLSGLDCFRGLTVSASSFCIS
jgi:hypothetical protein